MPGAARSQASLYMRSTCRRKSCSSASTARPKASVASQLRSRRNAHSAQSFAVKSDDSGSVRRPDRQLRRYDPSHLAERPGPAPDVREESHPPGEVPQAPRVQG